MRTQAARSKGAAACGKLGFGFADYRTGRLCSQGGLPGDPHGTNFFLAPCRAPFLFHFWLGRMGVEGEVRAGRRLLLPACSASVGPRSIEPLAAAQRWVGRSIPQRPKASSPYLLVSPSVSPYLPPSPSISPYLPYFSSRISYLPVCGISRYCNFAVSRGISPYLAVFRRGYREKKRPRQGFMTMSPIARRRSQPAAGSSSEGPAAAAARPAADTPSPLRCCRAWRRRRVGYARGARARGGQAGPRLAAGPPARRRRYDRRHT